MSLHFSFAVTQMVFPLIFTFSSQILLLEKVIACLEYHPSQTSAMSLCLLPCFLFLNSIYHPLTLFDICLLITV